MHTPGPNFIGSQVQLLQRSTHVMHTACDSDGTWVAKPVFGKVQRPQRSQDDQRVCQERRHFGCEQVAAEVEVLQSISAPRVASSSAQPLQNEHRARVRQKVACQHKCTKLWATKTQLAAVSTAAAPSKHAMGSAYIAEFGKSDLGESSRPLDEHVIVSQ